MKEITTFEQIQLERPQHLLDFDIDATGEPDPCDQRIGARGDPPLRQHLRILALRRGG